MKFSEFIDRLNKLQTVIGGDPEVVVQKGNMFESATAELQFVEHFMDNLYISTDSDKMIQVIKVF